MGAPGKNDYATEHVKQEVPPATPEEQAELDTMYKRMDDLHLKPLWTQIGGLMPNHPEPRAVAHKWDWAELLKLAQRSGELVPVGRGGERRAIGLANPGLDGNTYISPTLWAAIQYLAPGENAPEHRHSQNAFRFVIEGEGVWTVVNGDPVPMRRGDFLLTPGWNYHGHHNIATEPMAWLDGLDIPFAYQMDTGFFEYGTENSLTNPPQTSPVQNACGPTQDFAQSPSQEKLPTHQLGATPGSTPTQHSTISWHWKKQDTQEQSRRDMLRFASPTQLPVAMS